MFDDDTPVLLMAETRVCKAMEVVARQRMLVARLMLSGRCFARQADLLRAFEGDLASFEQHLAFLQEHRPSPALPRR